MNSPSLLDYFAEKIHSYSTKMRGDSLVPYNTSFLMPGNSILQQDPVKILNDLREYGILENPNHRTMIINQVLEELGAYQSLRYLHNIGRKEVFSSVNNTVFSPHFLTLLNALNSFCFKNILENSIMPYNSSITGNMNNFFNRMHPIDLETDSDLKTTCNLPISDSKMSESNSVACSVVPAALKQNDENNKCNMSATVKLNLKLTNRKTKQMNRRSRNRRRRQKKSMHANYSSSSSSDEGDDNNNCNGNLKCPVSGSVSFVTESPSFECTVSFQHTAQIPSLVSSFVVPVESDSDDDSDWESYDKVDYLNEKSCEVSSMHVVPSSDNSSATSDSSDGDEKSCGFSFVVSDESSNDDDDDDNEKSCGFSFVVSDESSDDDDDDNEKSCGFSFVVPDESSNDDDGDWDACDTSDFTDVTEFEFTGLFITNLCCLHKVPNVTDCEPETDESLQIRKEVLEANKKWNELKDVEKKSASKITFAVDDDLVTVYHVEMFERKGEWETYATERLRFKRRIGELEKVLSPCLDSEHRSNIFKKLIEPDL